MYSFENYSTTVLVHVHGLFQMSRAIGEINFEQKIKLEVSRECSLSILLRARLDLERVEIENGAGEVSR